MKPRLFADEQGRTSWVDVRENELKWTLDSLLKKADLPELSLGWVESETIGDLEEFRMHLVCQNLVASAGTHPPIDFHLMCVCHITYPWWQSWMLLFITVSNEAVKGPAWYSHGYEYPLPLDRESSTLADVFRVQHIGEQRCNSPVLHLQWRTLPYSLYQATSQHAHDRIHGCGSNIYAGS